VVPEKFAHTLRREFANNISSEMGDHKSQRGARGVGLNQKTLCERSMDTFWINSIILICCKWFAEVVAYACCAALLTILCAMFKLHDSCFQASAKMRL